MSAGFTKLEFVPSISLIFCRCLLEIFVVIAFASLVHISSISFNLRSLQNNEELSLAFAVVPLLLVVFRL